MNFLEMVKELQSGNQTVRESWTYDNGYLVVLPRMETIWKIVFVFNPATGSTNPNATNFLFTLEDFEADDWKLTDHVKPEEALKEELKAE